MLLQDLQVVIKVAEFHSITAAAESLDMRIATASAALKRVESYLGTQLFIRTTRQLRLSAAGEKYLPHCEQALLTLDLAKQHLKGEQDVVDGELRIALSSDLGRNLIIPWLDEFMQNHTQVSVKAHISDSVIDFYRDPVDIALRYGSPTDSRLYGFKVCNVPSILCASQAYLDNNGTPHHPNDLVNHNGLFYQLYDIQHDNWVFSKEQTTIKINMKGNRATNDGDVVRRWCLANKGLAVKSSLDISADLIAGNLVRLLPDYQLKPTELWLVCPSRQSITPAVRLLRDALKEKCQALLLTLYEQDFITRDALN